MKKLFLFLGLASLALTSMLVSHTPHSAQAAILGAPYIPEIDQRFNALEGPSIISNKYANFAADSVAVKHTAQATYDFSVSTGAIGTYDLHVSLPKNAVIVRSYLYSITAPTTSASGTLSFKCQNASDIIAATAAASYAAAGASIDGASTGAATAFKYITAVCDMQAVIATGALTAGKVTAYVEYVIHQ